jgi:hypothetical protein
MPPSNAALEPVRALLRAHTAPLPYQPDVLEEYGGGHGGAPARLTVLFPPGTARSVATGLADRLRMLPMLSDVAVLAPADGDELPPVPAAG